MDRLLILREMALTSLQAEFQYRANVIASILGGFIYQLTGFVVVWIIVDRFETLGGWTLPQITFLYGMRLTAHGIYYACFSQMFELDRVLITGEFDRFLVRPMSPLLQLFTRKLRVNCFGDLIGGTTLLAFAAAGAGIDWSLGSFALLIAAVVGGALIEGAVQVMMGSLAFRFLNVTAARVATNEVFNLYGNYPMTMFPRVLEYLLTFALPVAFVAYLPASTILGRTDGLSVAPWVGWLAPLLGVVLFTIAVRIWTSQSRHYQSSGH